MRTPDACLAALVVVAAFGLAGPATSQLLLQRPIKIVVPFAAGGASDIAARILTQRLGEAFGQQFVIENRPGASGAIAAEAVARSPADGHTLFMATTGQIAITPVVTKTSYDPVKDFSPITIVGITPFLLVVHPSVPAQTVGEFVEYVRRRPNEITYASSGVGTTAHLAMALFMKRAGLDMVAVNYRGGAAPVPDVVAGRVQVYIGNLASLAPYAASGALRPLAVSSERRAQKIPQVLTLIESGFPGFRAVSWIGLMAPAKTPKTIIDRIATEVSVAVKDPKIAERLASNGVDPVGSTPEEFAAMIAADIAFWTEAIKAAGAREK